MFASLVKYKPTTQATEPLKPRSQRFKHQSLQQLPLFQQLQLPLSMHHLLLSQRGLYCRLPKFFHLLEFSVSGQTAINNVNTRKNHREETRKEKKKPKLIKTKKDIRINWFTIPNLQGLPNSHSIACDSLLWSCYPYLWCSVVAIEMHFHWSDQAVLHWDTLMSLL